MWQWRLKKGLEYVSFIVQCPAAPILDTAGYVRETQFSMVNNWYIDFMWILFLCVFLQISH